MKRILLLLLIVFAALGNAFGQYTFIGAASQQSCHAFTVTPDLGGQKGAVWNNTQINLNNSFDFNFDVWLGCHGGTSNGADGMVFVLQNSGLNATGGQGADIGYGSAPAFFANSIAVEMDTYQNANCSGTDPRNDPLLDHIAILKNGSTSHCNASTIAGPVQAANGNIADCQYHSFRVKWNATTKILEVYFNNILALSTPIDIVSTIFLGNPNVYWGFTASTGGQTNEHRFQTALSPYFHLLATQKRCVGEPIQFIDSTVAFAAPTSFEWNFGDGSPVNTTDINPVHTYATGGTYTVRHTITGVDGCVEFKDQQILIGTKPVAAITAAGGCINTNLSFLDASTVTFGTINKWYWDLGDNTSSALQNPSDIYTVPGPKTIRLAVKSLEGCESDTVTKVINMDPEPTADFSFTNGNCEGNTVQFNDLSTVLPGNITSWNWNFGSGPGSTLQNPTHVFTAGTYTVTLTATTTGGCSKSISKSITVAPKPVAYFKYTTLCQSAQTTLTDSSYTVDNTPITQWWWDLGNGQFSTQQNPVTTYNTTGQFTIRFLQYQTPMAVSRIQFPNKLLLMESLLLLLM